MIGKNNIVVSLIIITGLFVVLICPGCVPAPPRNAADELKLNEWELSSASGSYSGRLTFSDTQVELLVSDKSNKIPIKGEYFTNGDRIVFVTNSYGILCFSFHIEKDSLILDYSGKSVVFVKVSDDR